MPSPEEVFSDVSLPLSEAWLCFVSFQKAPCLPQTTSKGEKGVFIPAGFPLGSPWLDMGEGGTDETLEQGDVTADLCPTPSPMVGQGLAILWSHADLKLALCLHGCAQQFLGPRCRWGGAADETQRLSKALLGSCGPWTPVQGGGLPAAGEAPPSSALPTDGH
ncbi:hypothetical protein TREES_T100010168 [Tupaia chinensis]|uniref:Uncharacterized protein n=1 Tax=Tupaia chinensis TaxID=246437 RepID=L9JBS4_TUPCH|nr:hypothetical protein TREES_T100010168 [Tupaia chinensis]